MNCKKCGTKLSENSKYCLNCGEKINNEKNVKINGNESKETTIYIVLFFLGLLGFCIANETKVLFFLLSLTTIVTGFVKFPNNIFIKVLFWIFLILVIIGIIYIILFMITCMNILNDCRTLG